MQAAQIALTQNHEAVEVEQTEDAGRLGGQLSKQLSKHTGKAGQSSWPPHSTC